jgi:hypothetical protein
MTQQTQNLTAVEWFYQRILAEDIKEIFDQAKEMEKEQIVDFAMQMHKIDCSKTGTDILLNEAEHFYNETYNK